MDKQVRATLLEMNKKRTRIKSQMFKASQENVRKRLRAKVKFKKFVKSAKEVSSKLPECNLDCTRKFFYELFPFYRILRQYSIRKSLISDVLAGLTVGIVHIPQGMAYGLLCNLPPVYGLYTSFLPVILYCFFGSSKHISMGTFAVTSLMIGSVVERGFDYHILHPQLADSHVIGGIPYDGINVTHTLIYSDKNRSDDNAVSVTKISASLYDRKYDDLKIGYAVSVTFVSGVFQLLLGCLRWGFLASFMSDPMISGFTAGAAVHVFSSQFHHLFGIKIPAHYGPMKLIYFYRDFFTNIKSINPVTSTASVTATFVLILIKEGINNNPNCAKDLIAPIPIELFVVIAGTLISYYSKIGEDFDVDVVGKIPQGLPPANVENLRYVSDVIGDGIIIGIVGFSVSYAMAKIIADSHEYEISANQELVANGVCNLIGSCFSCFVSAASLSRSLVQVNSGGATQLVGIFSSIVVMVVLLYIGPLFESLPLCILACIVIVSLKGMIRQFKEVRTLWRVCKRDFVSDLMTY